MENKTLTYIHWETGEKITKKLSFSHPSENKSGVFCPFDGTEIVRWYDHMSKGYDCPNCGMDYSGMKGNSQKEAERIAKEHFQNLEKRLGILKKEQQEIILNLNHAKEKGLYSKVNKK